MALVRLRSWTKTYHDTGPLPEGTRIVAHPFETIGAVTEPSDFGCRVLLDEPLAHTDRVYTSWSDVEREGDYYVREAKRTVERAENHRDDERTRAQAAKRSAAKAQKRLTEARAELRAAQREWPNSADVSTETTTLGEFP